MPRPAREAVMTALFNALVAAVQTNFTANTTLGSQTLGSPSTSAGLFLGLPVFGPGITRGSVIQTLSPLTISQVATATATAVSLQTGFLTTGRRLKPWGEATSQPALFLRDGDHEKSEYVGTILRKQVLMAEVWIYNNAGQNPDLAPMIPLNYLLDAVDAAFAPDTPTSNKFTLGGLVEWCRISPQIQKWPGDLDGQAIAVMDVEITVP